MMETIEKYLGKLVAQGLVDSREDASLFSMDDRIYSKDESIPQIVEYLFKSLNITSLIMARPSRLILNIIGELKKVCADRITPKDSESITFMHDIPVLQDMDSKTIATALKRRKGCIATDGSIITTGSFTLEQAFVVFSSICFALFVKYFSDVLNSLGGSHGNVHDECTVIEPSSTILGMIGPPGPIRRPSLVIPESEDDVISTMVDTGKATVESGLVDSFFGNISYTLDDYMYISQTAAALDELEGLIDKVALDGSSTNDITSSSEMGSHLRIHELTLDRAILHGHPKFSVIMSMYGKPMELGEKRYLGDIPVVHGRVGAGKKGLVHVLPPAMQESRAAIAYGHGTFTSGSESFLDAFDKMLYIENACFEMLKGLLSI